MNINNFLDPGVLNFKLKDRVYKNNSVVAMDDIGVDDDALLCMTELEDCCKTPLQAYFYFPNGSEVEYFLGNGVYRNRGSQVVRLNRQGLSRSQTGEYHCLIPDLIGRNQSIFITIIGKICSICTSILLYIYI